MRSLRIFSVFFLLLLPSTPLAAQEHHHYTQAIPGVNPPDFQQYMERRGYIPKATPRDESGSQANEGQRFGWWGYRHAELHEKGIVAQLQKLTGGTCCDGPTKGECRISSVDIPGHQVLVDGEWQPYDGATKIVVMGELESFRDGNEAIAVVCAGRTFERTGWSDGKKRTTPPIYCIGLLPAKT